MIKAVDTKVAALEQQYSEQMESITDVMPTVSVSSEVPLVVEWESGVLDPNTGAEIVNAGRCRSVHITVGHGTFGTVTGDSVAYWVRVYDADGAFVGSAYQYSDNSGRLSAGAGAARANNVDVDSVLMIYPTAASIRLVANMGDVNAITMSFTTISVEQVVPPLDDVYVRRPVGESTEDEMMLEYSIDAEHYTRGYLMLPPNYDRFGASVPLIVFVHGSADFTSLASTTMTYNYMAYYTYLRDCGYAIFDCHGWGSNVSGAGANTWASPTTNKAYRAGIRYVLDHYNIDRDNIFVGCKSLGGIQALALAHDPTVSIRACGMLAPELDPLVLSPMGYTQTNRVLLANDWGLDGDWESVLDVSNDAYDSAAYKAYIVTQADKVIGWNPFWAHCLSLLTPAEKVTKSLGNGRADATLYRWCDTPIKIWCAEDDASVWYPANAAYIATLKNGGSIAELRTMPSGTGGHHSVDNAEAAPKVDSITTALGITHADIPLAYVELEAWFRANMCYASDDCSN